MRVHVARGMRVLMCVTGLHPSNVRYEPAVYAVTPRGVPKDETCIAMTRAVGDFYAHPFGLTAEPSLSVHMLENDGDYCILAGSDGIWDCWRYEMFAEFVKDSILVGKMDAVQLSTHVLTQSINIAKESFGARHVDDASFVCWRLRPDGISEGRRAPLSLWARTI